MPMHRKNTARPPKRSRYTVDAPWFLANVRRQRRRNQLARLSRRKNQRREKGK